MDDDFFTDEKYDSPRVIKIGDPCNVYDPHGPVCISGNCCDGICKEYYDVGSECKLDCECLSENCLDGKCIESKKYLKKTKKH